MVNIDFKNNNVLILGAPRSGTHALASIIHQSHPELNYLGEIGLHQKHPEPWKDFELFYDNTPRKLAHVSQSYSKLFAGSTVEQLKKSTTIVEIRRRDKIKQFASWIFFKHIGAIYNFQHDGQDYLPPGSLTVTLADIEAFIVDQIVDYSFNPEHIFYYEDLDLSHSTIKKNQYVYPIEQIISNLDLVKLHLGNWKYNV